MSDATGQGGLLCLDGGRSGCRARLRLPTGEAHEGTGPPLPYTDADGGVAGVLEAVDHALSGLRARAAATVVAGLAGVFEHPATARALAAAFADRTGAARVIVTGDLVTAYAGALGLRADGAALRPGVVVAAGTGAVAFAVGAGGATARADGWGYLLGDAGGGFSIGRAGLEAALAHRDGRGGSAALCSRAEARFGPIEGLPDVVYRAAEPVTTVAAFARDVAEAARAGDAFAAGLWDAAGRALATSAAAAARQVLGDAPADVAWTGGLFDAGELLNVPFHDELSRRAPQLALRPPAGTALDGAEQLATLDPLPAALGHTHRAT